MRKIKNVLAIVLAVIMVLSAALVSAPETVKAAERVTTDDGFILETCNTIYLSGYEVIGYTGQKTELVIPDHYGDLPVIIISKEAFMDNKNLKSVKIPETVYKLETRAFKGCTALTSVEFLGDCRDYLAENSKSTSLPFHIKMGDEVFADCTALEYFEFPYGWDTVSSSEVYFKGSGVKKLKLVIGVGSDIGTHFNGMSELEQIDIDYGFDTSWYCSLRLSLLADMPKLKVINVYDYDSHYRYDLGLAYHSQYDHQITKCTALKEINVYCSDDIVGDNITAISGIQNISSDESVILPSDNRVSGYPVEVLSTGRATLTTAESAFKLNFFIGEGKTDKKNLSDAKISLPADTFIYTGEEIEPYAVLTYEKTVLQEGTDYTVKCADNKEVGTAKITFTGKGDYTGEVSAEYYIAPDLVPVYLKKAVISGKTAKLEWNTFKGADGYQVYYSSKKSKGYKKLYSGKDISLSTKTVKSGTYIKIRTYKKIGKKTYYSAWSAPVQVK